MSLKNLKNLKHKWLLLQKSESLPVQTATVEQANKTRRSRALRNQLLLWYGSLVALSLFLFAYLVQALLSNALYEGIDNTINAEARVAMVSIQNELKLNNYPLQLPSPLSLPALDTSDDIGLVVEVRNTQGQEQYINSNSYAVPMPRDILSKLQAGQTPELYYATVNKEQVRVAAQPIFALHLDANGNIKPGPVIGMLLVSKSLQELESTLFLLRLLMLLSGLGVLVASLLGGRAIAGNALRPLTEMIKTARSIASTVRGTHVGNLSQRVPRPPGRGSDEMVQLVDTFNDMLAALESATRAQRRFVADASHELRAPLTTIQGNLAFLQRHIDELPEGERRTMLSDAHQETLRLARLVDDLLLLARADSGSGTLQLSAPVVHEHSQKSEPPTQPVEWDRALLQLVRQLRGRLSVEGSQLQLEIGHIEPVRVRADEETLRRVMLILVDNAIKYTPTRDSSRKIIVSLQRLDKEAVFHIRDNGIGIEPDDVPHIFERFFRADLARSRKGTGLGLSIAQVMVEQLDGRITVESTPGQGSTFSIWLPLV
jgi:two-component system, OmpR family, sensor kinase